MRRLFLAIVAFAFALTLFSQCPVDQYGNVTLHQQSDLDTFAAKWPNCEHLQANLILRDLQGRTNIQNLNALSNIKTIDGKLIIEGLFPLRDLSGLESLESVSESITLEDNKRLLDISTLKEVNTPSFSLINCPEIKEPVTTAKDSLVKLVYRQLPWVQLDVNGVQLDLLLIDDMAVLETINIGPGTFERITIYNAPIKSLRKSGSQSLQLKHLDLLYLPDSIDLSLVSDIYKLQELYLAELPWDDLSYFSHMDSIDRVFLNDLNNITSFRDFSETTIKSTISVVKCDSFRSLEGMEKNLLYSNTIQMYSNPNLSMCDELCPRLKDTTLTTELGFNAPGCADTSEIRTDCFTSTISRSVRQWNVHHTSGHLGFEFRDNMPKEIQIISLSGQVLASHSSSALRLSLEVAPAERLSCKSQLVGRVSRGQKSLR